MKSLVLAVFLLVSVFLGASPVPSPPVDGSLGPVSWSADRSSWAAPLANDPNRSLVVNGKGFGPYRAIGQLEWAPVGPRWFIRLELDASSRGLLADGTLYGPFQDIRDATFDTSGAHLVFAFRRQNSWHLWQDGKEVGSFDSAGVIVHKGSAMGTWGTSKTNKTTLFLGGKTYGPYDWVNPGLDWMSDDGTSYATRAYKGGVSYLLHDGKEERRDNLKLERTPGGGYWLSWGQSEAWMFLIGDKVYGPYNLPPLGWGGGGPFFFEDGTNWAMSTLVRREGGRDDSQVIVNGTARPGWNVAKIQDAGGEAFTWFEGGEESDLVFSRYHGTTETTTLYRVSKQEEGWILEREGVRLGPYEALGRPVVLPDGSHWAVLARVAEGRFRAIFDGVEGVLSPAGVGAESLTIDPQGRHVTYHLRLHNDDLEAYQITDNVVSGPFARAGVPQFSVDGKRAMLWSEPLKRGNVVLTFDGKTYGPFTGLRGGDRQYFDLDHGHFVFQNRAKAGAMAITDQGNFGPYEEVYPLVTGHRVNGSYSGLLWAFVGRLQGGKAELHVFPGFPGGDHTYPGVALPSEGDSDVTPDGQDWRYPLAAPATGTLHNGLVEGGAH